jgi:hypothetical protein
MKATEKIFKIEKIRKGRISIIEGTLDYLTQYFSYTLLIGNSYNKKINLKPSTIKSLISNLEKSLDIQEGACYERTLINLL